MRHKLKPHEPQSQRTPSGKNTFFWGKKNLPSQQMCDKQERTPFLSGLGERCRWDSVRCVCVCVCVCGGGCVCVGVWGGGCGGCGCECVCCCVCVGVLWCVVVVGVCVCVCV